MESDLLLWAQRLQVVDVWKPGNVTGWVTDRRLFDPRVPDSHAPRLTRFEWWMDHGTVGTNTLRFWGTNGSIANGTWSLANYLIPHESTRYADGSYKDTTYTVFKMVPDGTACNHTGDCIGPIHNGNTIGCEYESLQNGTHDIDVSQYIKGALLYAYASASLGIRDYSRVPHGLVAEPWGRRSDPWAGKLDIAKSWEYVQAIRRDERIWRLWGIPQPQGGN